VYAFARGGSIIVHKEKVRQTALLARNDTGFNLTVYLNRDADENGSRKAKGLLYLDDGETYNYQRKN
jgi:alpha-glucosidase (family GH31 glycosyl hydrolase)